MVERPIPLIDRQRMEGEEPEACAFINCGTSALSTAPVLLILPVLLLLGAPDWSCFPFPSFELSGFITRLRPPGLSLSRTGSQPSTYPSKRISGREEKPPPHPRWCVDPPKSTPDIVESRLTPEVRRGDFRSLRVALT